MNASKLTPNVSVLDLESMKTVFATDEVKRNLKARHISMIALGGTIGTGLFISTKKCHRCWSCVGPYCLLVYRVVGVVYHPEFG